LSNGLITPFAAPLVAAISQSGSSTFVDTGANTPSVAPPTTDQSSPPASYQPPSSTPFEVKQATTAQGTGTSIYSTGNSANQMEIKGAVACDTQVAGATVVLTVKYSDPSGFTQPLTATANCTTLGPNSVAQINQVVRTHPNTAIGASTSITGSPVYDASAVVVIDTP
jgi:hypothetical protein